MENIALKTASTNFSRIKNIILFLLFTISLYPFSISIAGSGVSASYFFLLLIVIPLRRLIHNEKAIYLIFFYIVILFMGFPRMIYQVISQSEINYAVRTILSFFAFIAPLSLLFVRFKEEDIKIFSYAVIIASVLYSFNSIYIFISNQGMGVFEFSALTRSQRYGFVLCLGFFLALYESKFNAIMKIILVVTILLGIMLTFTRSSFLSLLVSLFAVMFVRIFRMLHGAKLHIRFQTIKALFMYGFLSLLVVILFSDIFMQLWNFYDNRLFSMIATGELSSEMLRGDTDSSEGYRWYVLGQILHYVSLNPLTGSNFSGLYLLFDEYQGSASTHNQYTDVLLRTGILGLGVYVLLLFRMLRFYIHDKGIFFGLIAILVYGLFHETFKEGQGSFIFGFLLSYSWWMCRDRSTAEQPLTIPKVAL